MSVQFDQVVSVYEGRSVVSSSGKGRRGGHFSYRQLCTQARNKDLKSSLENRYLLNYCGILFHSPSLS